MNSLIHILKILLISLFVPAVSGCNSSVPMLIEIADQSGSEDLEAAITLDDQRPERQKKYRSPAELKDTVHGLGDENFTLPPLRYITNVINKRYTNIEEKKHVTIQSLDMRIFDPYVSMFLTSSEKASVQYLGPGGIGMASIFQSMMASGDRKRYMVIELEYEIGKKSKLIKKDGYIIQSSIHEDIERIIKSVAS